MARVCDICNKGYMKGNLVPRGIGRRVTNRSIKKQRPNLRRKKLIINGQTITASVCAACLKRMKFDKKQAEKKTQEA